MLEDQTEKDPGFLPIIIVAAVVVAVLWFAIPAVFAASQLAGLGLLGVIGLCGVLAIRKGVTHTNLTQTFE